MKDGANDYDLRLVDEGTLSYEREFVLQSCHFNSQQTYEKYNAALLARNEDRKLTIDSLFEVLPDIHGHNFTVLVVGDVDATIKDPVVVWDEDLDKLVNEWNRTNLSVHPDFEGYRATTEVMAMLLKRKLSKRWPKVAWVVAVRETDDIRAVAS